MVHPRPFLITYDNRAPRIYEPLYRLMGAWHAVRLADSVWLANLIGPAPEIRRLVLSTLQWNDGIAVIELKPGSDWAVQGLPPAAANWLSAFVQPKQIAA